MSDALSAELAIARAKERQAAIASVRELVADFERERDYWIARAARFGATQSTLAAELGLSQQQVSNIVRRARDAG